MTPPSSPAWLQQLPEHLAYQVRTASLPPTARGIFAVLPEVLSLEVRVDHQLEELPRSAQQLLKSALVSTCIEVRELHVEEVPESIVIVVRGSRSLRWDAEALSKPLKHGLFEILEGCFEREISVQILEGLAFGAAVLETLRSITNHMLRSMDEDEALYIMLSGITSGYALGFNRAALFIWDDATRSFVGVKAIGPRDHEEAHRIWESIELDDKNIDNLIADYGNRNFDTGFQKHVQSITLIAGDPPDDEVSLALASPQARGFSPPLRNRSLAALEIDSEFVLARLHAHGRTLGLLYADNRYNGVPIRAEQLLHFSFFIDQTTLIWENLALLKRVEHQARIDSLTGIYNRRAFQDRFEVLAQEGVAQQGLLVLDLDHFKAHNDRLGHEAGDKRLQEVAAILSQNTREQDAVGRFGGDEFVILLPRADSEVVLDVMTRIGRTAHRSGISLSIGGAWGPTGAYDSLFATADARLYEAKAQGRGRGCCGGEMVVFGS